jgi:hypothetical protein
MAEAGILGEVLRGEDPTLSIGRALRFDKQIEHQQNLATLALPLVVIDAKSNALPVLLPFASFLRDLFGSLLNERFTLLRKECASAHSTEKSSRSMIGSRADEILASANGRATAVDSSDNSLKLRLP